MYEVKNTIFNIYKGTGLKVGLQPNYSIKHSVIMFKFIPFMGYTQELYGKIIGKWFSCVNMLYMFSMFGMLIHVLIHL